jgi:hypothetical protein
MNYHKFTITNETIIEKTSGNVVYQLYNKHHLPLVGRYFFTIRLEKLYFNDITIGIITESRKS